MIDTVDGQVLDPVKLSAFIRSLPMADANYILRSEEKLRFGLDTNLFAKCTKCGAEFDYQFPFTGEFFGPSID